MPTRPMTGRNSTSAGQDARPYPALDLFLNTHTAELVYKHFWAGTCTDGSA